MVTQPAAKRRSNKKIIELPIQQNLPALFQGALTLDETAAWLKVSRSTVDRLVSEEGLPTVLLGGERLVRVIPSSLQAWLERREQQQRGG